jgi:hypothetical protein
MNIKNKIRKTLREFYGDFETYLEHEYENRLTEHIYGDSLNDKKKWATYNQVLLELKHNIKDMLKVKELQYKLTEDNSNPTISCIDVLDSLKSRSEELERLYYKIKNFD